MFELFRGTGFTSILSTEDWGWILSEALTLSKGDPGSYYAVMDQYDFVVAMFIDGRRVPISPKQR